MLALLLLHINGLVKAHTSVMVSVSTICMFQVFHYLMT